MTILRSIAMAFSMFSQIPMPKIAWGERSMRYMLAAFPLVGVVIGLLLWGWTALCALCGFGSLIFSAGVTLIPVLVTGGFHLDGLADTADALASHADPERKRAILKDSNIGAFAAIWLGAYFIAYFAFAAELPFSPSAIAALCLVPVWSRSLSGLASTLYPGSASKGLLQAMRDASGKRGTVVVLLAFFAGCLACAFVFAPWQLACAMIVASLACLAGLYYLCVRQFGGICGDLSGFYLQVQELALLIVIVVFEGAILP